MNKITVKFKKLHTKTKIPTYGTEGSNGFDIYVPQTTVIPANSFSNMVDLGIAVELEPGYAMFLLPRSSMGTKTPIRLSNGVALVDSDFRGGIKAFFDNLSDEDYVINTGERVVQGVVVPIQKVEFVEVNELGTTSRDINGYGSTGK